MNTAVVPRLEPALRLEFAPLLRRDGFKGTGRKFYRRSGPWLHLFNVQGSRYGGSFAVNMAIHFAVAPDLLGNKPDPKKMTEAHCEFRRRLSQDGADMWWKHENTAESMLEAAKAAAAVYDEHGRTYFTSATALLDRFTPEDYATDAYDLCGFHSGKPRIGLALARIRSLQGKSEESRRFAKTALQFLQVQVAWSAELESLAAANDA